MWWQTGSIANMPGNSQGTYALLATRFGKPLWGQAGACLGPVWGLSRAYLGPVSGLSGPSLGYRSLKWGSTLGRGQSLLSARPLQAGGKTIPGDAAGGTTGGTAVQAASPLEKAPLGARLYPKSGAPLLWGQSGMRPHCVTSLGHHQNWGHIWGQSGVCLGPHYSGVNLGHV